MNRKFKYTTTISEEDLRDIIIDGVETGITYWALLNNDTETFKTYYDTTELSTSEIVAEILLNGGSVEITDMEGEIKAEYDLSLERLLRGIEKNAEERPFDCDLQNYDSMTCDCIFQYAIFDEIIFG